MTVHYKQNTPEKNISRIEFGQKMSDILAEGTPESKKRYEQELAKSSLTENNVSEQRVVAAMFGRDSLFKHERADIAELPWKTLVALSMPTKNYMHRVRITDLVLHGLQDHLEGLPLPTYAISPKNEPVYALVTYEEEFYSDVYIAHAKALRERDCELSVREEHLTTFPDPDLSNWSIAQRSAKFKSAKIHDPHWLEHAEAKLFPFHESEVYEGEEPQHAVQEMEAYSPAEEAYSPAEAAQFIEDVLDPFFEVPSNAVEVYNAPETPKIPGPIDVDAFYKRVAELTDEIRGFGDMVTATNSFLAQQDIIDALKEKLATELNTVKIYQSRADSLNYQLAKANEANQELKERAEKAENETAQIREYLEKVKAAISLLTGGDKTGSLL